MSSDAHLESYLSLSPHSYHFLKSLTVSHCGNDDNENEPLRVELLLCSSSASYGKCLKVTFMEVRDFKFFPHIDPVMLWLGIRNIEDAQWEKISYRVASLEMDVELSLCCRDFAFSIID